MMLSLLNSRMTIVGFFVLLLGTNYAFDWRLRTHPKDYSGEMEGKHSGTLKLSKVKNN